MNIGVYIFITEYTITIDELARELEARGFESLFVPEHTHIPASRISPWAFGDTLPKHYYHAIDPFVGLAAAAAVTSKLRLGTGICLLTERDPIVTAKEIATLDLISNGRVEFGIGAGWNAEEMANHGTVFETRFRVMEDRAKAIRAIWTQDEATYHGEFTNFDAIWSWPKPVQQPHPPILLGGETKHTMRRVMEFCDGWFPRRRAMSAPADEMAKLKSHAEAAGRDPATVSTTLFDAEPEQSYLQQCSEAGIDRALLALPSEGRDEVLAVLDRYQLLLS